MAVRTRNVLSLCAGVGGLELGIGLALDYLGEAARSVCLVEREAAAAASLVASMEAGWLHQAPIWSDMRTFDGKPWRGVVDILASGDPCQDNSVAGKQAGSDGARFLAPEVCRIAEECRPSLIFRENVPGNADGQLEAIIPALERLGYRVAAGIFSSEETGNTMRRERLFIMARYDYQQWSTDEEEPDSGPDGGRHIGRSSTNVGSPQRSGDGRHADDAGRSSVERTAADRSGDRTEQMDGPMCDELSGQQRGEHHAEGWKDEGLPSALPGGTILRPTIIPGPEDSRWRDVLERFPELQPAVNKKEAESLFHRGFDAMAYRVERLRATGNGVDPLAAAYAFLSLNALLSSGA